MTPKCFQIDSGSARMSPPRVLEVSGASPGVADGPRRAAAGSPGGVKGPSRSACGTFPGDCPRSSCCSPRRSRFLPCASPQKLKKTDFPPSMSLCGSARSYVFFRVGAISAVLSFALVSSLVAVRKSSRNGSRNEAKMRSGRSGRSRKSRR